MSKFYKISHDELYDLIESEWMLTQLQDAGVDNWPGHDEADLWRESRNDEIEEEIAEFKEIEE